MNVMLGERYKEITDQVIHDQVIQYALGFWGEAERAAMNPTLRDTTLRDTTLRDTDVRHAPAARGAEFDLVGMGPVATAGALDPGGAMPIWRPGESAATT